MRYAELYDAVMTVNQQARALVGQTSMLLRALEPLARAEQEEGARQKEERPRPRTFGGKNDG